MEPADKTKKLWIMSASLVILVFLCLFLSLWLYNQNQNEPKHFILTDHTNTSYNSADDKRYKLIFFGFTYCPAICPTGLANIHNALETLGPLSDQITPILITIDPERDTTASLSEYLKNFGSGIIGLTGTEKELQTVRDEYAVYAKKIILSEEGDYTMDHSTHIYFTDKEDVLLTTFDYRMNVQKMAETIKRLIKQ